MTYGQNVQLRAKKYAKKFQDMLANFDCGNKHIDCLVWRDSYSSSTVSYLYVDEDSDKLVAYASIACSGIVVETSEFDGDDAAIEPESSILSAVEIEYFAVHKEYQKMPFDPDCDPKETLSYYIFMDMIQRIREISRNVVGTRAVVLYSLKNAVHFYEKCGLEVLPEGLIGRTDAHVSGCTPMYMRL